MKISQMAEDAHKKAQDFKGKDLTVLFGNQSSGKSTILSYLIGRELVAYEDPETFKLVISEKIGGHLDQSQDTSVTNSPRVYSAKDQRLEQENILELPGFSGSKAIEADIEDALFTKEVMSSLNSYKIIFVIDFQDIYNDNVDHFISLVNRLSSLFGDTDQLRNNFVTIFTKVLHNFQPEKLSKIIKTKINGIDIDASSRKLATLIADNANKIAIFEPLEEGIVNPNLLEGVIDSIKNTPRVKIGSSLGFPLSLDSKKFLISSYHDLNQVQELYETETTLKHIYASINKRSNSVGASEELSGSIKSLLDDISRDAKISGSLELIRLVEELDPGLKRSDGIYAKIMHKIDYVISYLESERLKPTKNNDSGLATELDQTDTSIVLPVAPTPIDGVPTTVYSKIEMIESILFEMAKNYADQKKAEEDFETLLSTDYNRAFYDSLCLELNSAYSASLSIHSNFVDIGRKGSIGYAGDALTIAGNFVPGFGAGATVIGMLLNSIDKSHQKSVLNNLTQLASNPHDMEQIAHKIATAILSAKVDKKKIQTSSNSIFEKTAKLIKYFRQLDQTETMESKISGPDNSQESKRLGKEDGQTIAKILLAKILALDNSSSVLSAEDLSSFIITEFETKDQVVDVTRKDYKVNSTEQNHANTYLKEEAPNYNPIQNSDGHSQNEDHMPHQENHQSASSFSLTGCCGCIPWW
ncbi:MAG: hypothetical protein SFT93_02815 [Rickettsiaceae bacterium]|nr:hypothetical protein [Rickettsiaceae bacterium]